MDLFPWLEKVTVFYAIAEGANRLGTKGQRSFFRLAFVWQVVLLLIFLIGAVACGYYYWRSINSYANFMEKAAATHLEPNDQPFRALEAYLLSDLPDKRDGAWEGIDKNYFDIHEKKLIDELPKLTTNDWTSLKVKPQLEWSSVNPDSQYLMSTDSLNFLYQPKTSLQMPLSLRGVEKLSEIDSILVLNPEIKLQIIAAYKTMDLMNYVIKNNATIDGYDVVQCYFMGESGTLLIMGHETSYYGKFPPNHYFPSRPYFWNSVNRAHPAGGFQEVTYPYIDYGGNGIVKTYCIKLELPNKRYAMIGFDCKISPNESRINEKITALGPIHTEFKVWKNTNDSLWRIREDGDSDVFREIDINIMKINNSKPRHTADLTGVITYFVRNESGEKKFLLAVPTATLKKTEGTETTFCLAMIDQNAIEKQWPFLVMGVVLSVFCAWGIGLMMAQYYNTRTEQEHLLDRFSKIMEKSSVPFVWLNDQNEFERANKAFVDTFGYGDFNKLKWKECKEGKEIKEGRTFKEMIAKEQWAEYTTMHEQSARGEFTDEHLWKMQKQDGTWINVLTQGEGVLIRSPWKKDKLIRFGIIVEVPDPEMLD